MSTPKKPWLPSGEIFGNNQKAILPDAPPGTDVPIDTDTVGTDIPGAMDTLGIAAPIAEDIRRQIADSSEIAPKLLHSDPAEMEAMFQNFFEILQALAASCEEKGKRDYFSFNRAFSQVCQKEGHGILLPRLATRLSRAIFRIGEVKWKVSYCLVHHLKSPGSFLLVERVVGRSR